MEFRKDINGLRAIAVLAVVFFHFGVAGFKGGFAGVDIFFVISGYLMTRIIFSKLEKNQFSLSGFYLARAQRIIPALIFMCASLFVLLWFFLPPSEFIQFNSQIAGAVSFVSNIQFWRAAGYFDSDSHEKWLLHTWSLSVEWQFYILYPIFILAARHFFSEKIVKHLLVAGALLSFGLSALLPMRWLDAGFYLLPTRAWEMIAGGIVFLYPVTTLSRKKAITIELVGVVLILISIFLLDSSLKWPGYFALIPVMGASLVLIAANNASWITGNVVMQFIGKISYSYYLWHWPVCVALYYFQESSNSWKIVGILGSLVLAYLSFQFVEQTTRGLGKKAKNPIKPLVAFGAAAFLISIAGVTIVNMKGIPSRLDPLIVSADFERQNQNPRHLECRGQVTAHPKLPLCIFGAEQDKIGLIVVGDSHSNAVVGAIADSMPTGKGGVLHFGADGCPTIKGITNSFVPYCDIYNEKVINTIMDRYPSIPIIVVNRTTASLIGANESKNNVTSYIKGTPSTSPEYPAVFKQGFKETVCTISRDRKVFILKPIPEMKTDVPMQIIKNLTFRGIHKEIFIKREEYDSRHKLSNEIIDSVAKDCDAKTLDPTIYLCDGNKCNGTSNGRSLYYDDDHLSEFGNRFLTPLFREIWL